MSRLFSNLLRSQPSLWHVEKSIENSCAAEPFRVVNVVA